MLPTYIVQRLLSNRQREELAEVFEPRLISTGARTREDRIPPSESAAQWARFQKRDILPSPSRGPDVDVKDRDRLVWIEGFGHKTRLYGTYVAENVRLAIDGMIYLAVRAIDPLEPPQFDYYEAAYKESRFVPMIISAVDLSNNTVTVMENDKGELTYDTVQLERIVEWLDKSETRRRGKHALFALAMARRVSNQLDEALKMKPELRTLLARESNANDADLTPMYLVKTNKTHKDPPKKQVALPSLPKIIEPQPLPTTSV